MKSNNALVWLTIIPIISLAGGSIVLAIATFVTQIPDRQQNVNFLALNLATTVGISMLSFGLLSMLFTLTARSIVNAINSQR